MDSVKEESSMSIELVDVVVKVMKNVLSVLLFVFGVLYVLRRILMRWGGISFSENGVI